MKSFDHRTVVSQLAEDLAWLEEHSRRDPELAPQAGQLRMAAGLVRNVIGPFLNRQPPVPLHVAVVGGAGTGKSTVVNLLCGRAVAEANPQAGFTRHPTAYVPPGLDGEAGRGELGWSSYLGFLGPLRRLPEPAPSDLDQDVYQVRRVSPLDAGADGDTPLANCVIWDCPDMTTWAATGYLTRLLEVASLADVVVYVASDERYNDAVPTEFLFQLIKLGKPVVAVLTKMREAEAPQILAHFRSEVLDRAPAGPDGTAAVVPCVAVPALSPEQLADPAREAARFRVPLLNQIEVLCEPADAARRRTVLNALAFLNSSGEGLLQVARQDLEALEAWRGAVLSGRAEFNRRYRQEYLDGERFRRFEETHRELMELLELPNVGRAVGTAFWVLRAPYRLLRGLAAQVTARPESVNLPERAVLEQAFDAWLDQLRSEALQRADSHPVWKHVAHGFQTGLADLARDRFQADARRYELSVADEVEGARRAVPEQLRQNPARLGLLRAGKLGLDLLAVGAALWVCGLSLWLLLAVPVFVSLSHQLVEWGVGRYVEQKREQARLRQEALMSQFLSAPMGEWLAQWPVTGGSTYERLQRALRRIPELVRRLTVLADERLSSAESGARGAGRPGPAAAPPEGLGVPGPALRSPSPGAAE